MSRLLIAGAVLMAASAGGAAAGDAQGEWLRENGAAKVRIVPCGEALCGAIVWLRDSTGPAKVGKQVFFAMRRHGENAWTGSAFRPEDGKTYSGRMTLSGDRLVTAGCMLGGLVCKSVAWTRVR